MITFLTWAFVFVVQAQHVLYAPYWVNAMSLGAACLAGCFNSLVFLSVCVLHCHKTVNDFLILLQYPSVKKAWTDFIIRRIKIQSTMSTIESVYTSDIENSIGNERSNSLTASLILNMPLTRSSAQSSSFESRIDSTASLAYQHQGVYYDI